MKTASSIYRSPSRREQLSTSPGIESRRFEGSDNLRLYFNDLYRRWTVDVLRPSQVARKTFENRDDALHFAKLKQAEWKREHYPV